MALLFAAFPALASAAWNQPVGGVSPINQMNNQHALEPSLTAVGGVPYVAWRETDGTNEELRVARLNSAGTAWEQGPPWLGVSPTYGGINNSSSENAFSPSLIAIGGVPYVAWSERDTNFEIRVARLNSAGTAWEQVVGGASPINQANNQDAGSPSLTAIGGVPYVAWTEFDGTNYEIRVARLNSAGTAWGQVVGGASPINQASNRDASEPSLTAVGGVPYVAWRETDGTNEELRVARLNSAGTAWEQGPPWTGVSPTSGGINQASNQNARDPSLTAIGGVPYVAWIEPDGTNNELRVARLNSAGTAWEQVVGGASPINQAGNENGDTERPSLTPVGGIPYVAWMERDFNFEVRVSRLEPEFTAGAAVPTGENGATLVADVRTFGLPYPIGFQYGTSLESEVSTEPTPAGPENVTVSRQVEGLCPSTDYQFRPFAVAGVPQPRVLGPAGTFTTPSAQPGGCDTEGPNLELSGKRKQELAKRVTVTATCTDEPCELDATGKLALPGENSKRSLRAVKLRRANADADAGEPRKLRLSLRKRGFKVANRALDSDENARARLRVTATDATGNETTKTWKVKVVS